MVRLSVFAYRIWDRCIKIQVIGLLAVILALPAGVWAKPTTAAQARTVVANWLSLEAAPLGAALGAAQSRQVLEVKTYKHQGAPAYYVVYLNPSGCVIVPADDLVEPIIAFLPTGDYDPSPVNPLGAMVSQDLVGRVLDARQKEMQAQTGGLPLVPAEVYAGAQRKWALLAKGPTAAEAAALAQPTISDVRVAPLVKSVWDQSLVGDRACYNYYTPPNAAGSAANYVCGCVATAMAQLMRYYAYPKIGVGTGGFVIKVDGVDATRHLRGGDGAGGPYDWGNMPLIPGYSFTEAQRQAIGALTHDAGVSVGMKYGAQESSAALSDAAKALVKTFKYSNAKYATPVDYSSIPAADRNNMINPNLDAYSPTLLGIFQPAPPRRRAMKAMP